MRIDSYLCIESNKGRVVDTDDDDSPMVFMEFVNDAKGLDPHRKRMIVSMVANVVRALWPDQTEMR